MKRISLISAILAVPLLAANNAPPEQGKATDATKAANAAVAAKLPLADQQDFENARRGFLAKIEDKQISNPDGSTAWDVDQFAFIKGKAPATVNPSLWRQSQLLSIHGLFKVTDDIYQFRGYDLSVMTLIAGKKGWIIIDPLTTSAPARAGLALANEKLGKRPVKAVIFSHSHGDHFGGALGVVSEDDVKAGKVQIIAPHGFLAESIGESVIAGTTMNRRVQFQFGTNLPASPTGHVGTGLGQALSQGDLSLLPPTRSIKQGGEKLSIDGVDFEFFDAGGTEAPAELVFYLPKYRALHSAEVATRNFHNVLTPRGALVRDTLKWSRVIDDMLARFGDKSDVLLASHHWPVWDSANVKTALRNQRNLYRFVHDQTLRQANQGATIHEIAENIGEPAAAQTDFGVRDYYGTLNHNSKAVYQRYFGWWDGVPAHYYTLPPVKESQKYVEAMGGVDAALAKGKTAFEKGEYRWAAKLFNHIVFAQPDNEGGRKWLAATYEQLGFQAESGAWRNVFLTGAAELRAGTEKRAGPTTRSDRVLSAIPAVDLFNALATRFNPGKMTGAPGIIQFHFPDRDEAVIVDLGQSVLFPRAGQADSSDAQITISRTDFTRLLAQQASPLELIQSGALKLSGDTGLMARMFSALDPVDPSFNIVTP